VGLKNFFDTQLVRDRFESTSVTSWGLNEIESLASRKEDDISQLGFVIWHQIVTRNLFPVDPMEMQDDFDKPLSFRVIEKKVGKELLRDIWAVVVDVDDERLDDTACMELIVALIYPNDMVLLDVNFQDPYKPIPKSKRRFDHQTHEGLKMLDGLMVALESKAYELECNNILLTAASGDLVPLFQNYGFDLDGSQLSKVALEAGLGIPMVKELG
jgi:hypothetical protein